MDIHTLNVDLGDRSYPIFIGPGLLNKPECLVPYLATGQVMIVTNETVDPLYSSAIEALLKNVSKVDKVVLPDGEQFKNLETLNVIFDRLLQCQHNRKTTILALGGGVVGDMAGFAAASYQRGVGFVQVPTTLLAQVDSSVGGKTGVNHALGKNMIGAFYQPQAVVIDTEALNTLPKRELSAGLAEVIKYGLIADADFFSWLERNVEKMLARDPGALAYAIKVSCATKAEVVAKDETESGIRAILNLGHTFGHAIESHQGYGVWVHGEAVAAGMVMACDLSFRLGWLSRDIYDRAVALIEKAGLPISPPPQMAAATFMQYMAVDKKVLDGALRLVLLRGCGQAVVADNFSADALAATLTHFCR